MIQLNGVSYIEFNIYDRMSLELITNDANTIRNLYEYTKDKNYSSEFFMAIIPYTSIWIESTSSFLKQIGLDIYTSKEDEKLVKEIRSKIKMYNEKIKKNVEKSNLIYKFHNDLFKSIAKYNFIRKLNLYYDFGTYLIDNKYIGNTYLYHWYYGCSKKKEIDSMEIIEDKSYRISNILGNTLSLVQELTNKNEIGFLLNDELEISYKDYNLGKKNSKIFNGEYDKDATLILFNILCSINFVLYFLNKLLPKDNLLYFRIKYNCYYYSMYSLDKIIEYNKINKYDICTLETKINKLKREDEIIGNKFRNCMAHYNITEDDLKEDEIILGVPFYGLVEKCLRQDFNTLNGELSEKLIHLSDVLEDLILVKG